MQTNLFEVKKQRAVHLATRVVILIIKSLWINNVLHFDCAVPQTDDGVKFYFCNATYSDREIILI